jgi:acetoin utilization deacetylase AcuC-like enzyme
MTLLYYVPRFLDHDTGAHPEGPERLRATMARIEHTGLAADCTRPRWEPALRDRIERVHEPGHLERMAALSAAGGGHADSDTVISAASYDVATLAVGAACDAVDRVISGESKTAMCVVRPPGHHALADRAMGFCVFNNIAIAAAVARDEYALERILIVDWDVHHGNGTQDAFYSDERVGFLSSHRWPFYPGTGDSDETGSGGGLGTTLNLPVKFGTPRETYLERFASELEKFADRMRPQLVLLSAGFDSHRADPVGSLGLETEDFAELTKLVQNIAATHADGRIVSILEGGYNPPILADCVATHLHGLMDS